MYKQTPALIKLGTFPPSISIPQFASNDPQKHNASFTMSSKSLPPDADFEFFSSENLKNLTADKRRFAQEYDHEPRPAFGPYRYDENGAPIVRWDDLDDYQPSSPLRPYPVLSDGPWNPYCERLNGGMRSVIAYENLVKMGGHPVLSEMQNRAFREIYKLRKEVAALRDEVRTKDEANLRQEKELGMLRGELDRESLDAIRLKMKQVDLMQE